MSDTVLDEHEGVVLPPVDPMEMRLLDRLLRANETAVLRGPNNEDVSLPAEVYRALITVTDAMSRGQAIVIAPTNQRLTTSEAAQFLGVSRPTLVRILDEGHLAYERPNRHRRILLSDLVAFKEQRRVERRETLSGMTAEATEAGLYESIPSAAELGGVAKRARKAGSRSDT